jgi:hypothetical protein
MAEHVASEEECMRCIQSLKRCGINFLAIDFDRTLIDYHTWGKWQHSAADLARKVRPFFKMLVPLAISNGVHVAIVTLSKQTKLIQAVLDDQFPDHASYIPVRGHPSSAEFVWEYQGKGSSAGKQAHMASAAEELNNLHHNRMMTGGGGSMSSSSMSSGHKIGGGGGAMNNKITRSTSLLLDDDQDNINSALSNQVRAIYCMPGNIDVMVQEILTLE